MTLWLFVYLRNNGSIEPIAMMSARTAMIILRRVLRGSEAFLLVLFLF